MTRITLSLLAMTTALPAFAQSSDAVILPVDSAQTITPAAESIGIFTTPAVGLGTVEQAVPAVAPSIIIGLIEPTNASFSTLPDEEVEVASTELSFETVEARRALRESDPELFETLLTSGAFDPAEGQLAATLQVEMERMGCYAGRIDGDWGAQSRGATALYWDALGESGETAATIDLFRQVMRQGDVTCEASYTPPVRVQTTQTQVRTGGTQPVVQQQQQQRVEPQVTTPDTGRRTINRDRLRLPGGLGG